MQARPRVSQSLWLKRDEDRNYSNAKLRNKRMILDDNSACLGVKPERVAAIRRKAQRRRTPITRLAKPKRSAMTLTV